MKAGDGGKPVLKVAQNWKNAFIDVESLRIA